MQEIEGIPPTVNLAKLGTFPDAKFFFYIGWLKEWPWSYLFNIIEYNQDRATLI